ncbi:ribonuclease HI family protein [Kocuria massiliensis]|uniref:ribonuclease HI family protein n=1 Tax=Kocuria massiliensis TaxID=1926282 RepID=UPI0022B96D74|nr:ribonuclease HI family protein [Kocuria massiliensis]
MTTSGNTAGLGRSSPGNSHEATEGSDEPSTIVAAADGSALGNPGPAGWAWYVDESCWRAGGWPHGTNNMGELKAVLDLVEATASVPERPLKILCDSQYVIKCITAWMPGWKAKGWKKKDGKPVLNRDLLEQLDAALTGRTYEFEWVKGHAGHELNEHADDKARAAATAYQTHRSPDQGPGFTTDESGDSTDVASTPTGDQPSRAQETSGEIARRHELELSDPATYPDPSRLEPLLDDELVWITVRGRRAGRDTALRYPEQAFGLRDAPDIVSFHSTAEDVGLVVSRVETPRGPALRSSLWTRAGDRWKLSVRQDTPEA